MVLWSEDYIGLADEYEIVYQGKVQEFIVPAKVRYLVQPYRCYVVRCKDAPERSISCNLGCFLEKLCAYRVLSVGFVMC